DVGQRFSGSVNYSIPWINSNFLDFARHPTSLSLSLSSNAVGNNSLYIKGRDGLPTSVDTGRQYTVRSTGFNVAAARALEPNLMASAGISVSSSKYYLEPYKAGDSLSTTPANRATYQDDTAATVQLPLGATTVMPKLGLQYDTTDSVLAPSFGVRAQATLGYGVGRQSDGVSLSWGQVEAGSSTYYGFGRTLDDGSKQEVIAGRVNAGTIVGTGGESNVFTVGTNVFDPAYEIRGQSSTLHGTSYLTSSAELRHNFGVKLGDYVSGVYGLAFVDAGDAWTSNNGDNPFGLKVAYGVGAQVNTSLLNVQLTYGQSSSGNGRFALRLGRFW
uniref:BamA/TamA family outer membrane protein n=1 Tax=Deinococcus sp. TaxID=47478 RepID=UPI0025BB4977